jgi:hypothetical protein
MNQTDGQSGVSRTGVVMSLFCVGIFLLLLFPYLLQRRAAARRDTCQLHMTMLSVALVNYADVHESLPFGTVQDNLELAPEERLSWYPQLWPYLGNNVPPLDLRPDEPWGSAHNLTVKAFLGDPALPLEKRRDAAVLLCPSMIVQRDPEDPSPTSFVGIAGVGKDAAALPLSDPLAGAWGYDRCTPVGLLPAEWANVLLLGETGNEPGAWSAGGWSTVRGLDPEESQLIGPFGPLGGNHPGGGNVLIGMSCQFMTEQADTRVLTQLAVLRSELPESAADTPEP